MFLANYGDIVTDAPLDRLIEEFRAGDAVGALLSVRPTSYSFHIVTFDDAGRLGPLKRVTQADLRINGGYYIFRQEIFDLLGSGEDLVEGPFAALADQGRLIANQHDGFWVSLDTLKDYEVLQQLEAAGQAPWEVWRSEGPTR
jgi:glucose-1-phosphate cytidylyltransferase